MDKFSAVAVASQLRILRAILAPEQGVIIPPALRAQALHEANEMVVALRVAREETLGDASGNIAALGNSALVTEMHLSALVERSSGKPSSSDQEEDSPAQRLLEHASQLDEEEQQLTRYLERYFDVQIRKFETLSSVIERPVGA